jgi:hypothetical protein
MRQWGQVAARSNRALFWNDGPYPVIYHFHQKLDDLEANPAEAQRKNVRPQQHHGAHLWLC